MKKSIISLLLLLSPFLSQSEILQSGQYQPLVIALYTSQGCSSCPPADEWLSKYAEDSKLWTGVFPLAFHVTYWNYLGWRDRFSNQQFNRRQYDHLNMLNINQVFTPQSLVNGKEWRHWYSSGWSSATLPNTEKFKTGVLTVNLSNQHLTACYSKQLNNETKLNFAWVASGYKTKVSAGENEGRILNNPFVVLSMKTYLLKEDKFSGDIPTKPNAEKNIRLAKVIWLENQGKPIQAVGKWETR